MKKFLILGVVAVIALSALAVGYAHWTKTLYIDGTVTTGTFGVEWSQPTGWGENDHGKDVGTCDYVFTADSDTFTVNMGVAYPSYECWIEGLDIHGIGTVPADIDVVANTSSPYIEIRLYNVTWKGTAITVPGDPGVAGVEYLTLQNLVGYQLHNCDVLEFDLWFHVLQEVGGVTIAQETGYDIDVAITANQFNYVAP